MIKVALAFLLFCPSLVARHSGSSGWFLDIFDSVTTYVTTQKLGGMSFSFPDASSDHWVDYMLMNKSMPLSGNLAATFTIATTGTPVWNWQSQPFNTCTGVPAQVRLYFQSGNNDGQRWWSHNTSYQLASGTMTLTVPLLPAEWSGLNGEMANRDAGTIAWFNAALAGANQLGLSFGGGCFYGHGVNVSGGTADFTLTSFSSF